MSDELRDKARRGQPVLVPYDARWPERFDEAAAAIQEACGDVIIAVEHIGSTAVTGLTAKPYLDIMPGLRSFEDGRLMVEGMASLGYHARGEFGIPGRHYFSKHIDGDDAVWKHNVHAYAVGHIEWDRHLVFRDALRAGAALREEYAALKRSLAALHTGIEPYADAKGEFVERVITSHGGPSRPPDFPWQHPAAAGLP
jgi:GrpB-like predicted nucleotidyltransferase (UPF0157 family)